MRIRTIKPEFWQHEILAQMPEFTRLLAIGLLNYADDEGYFYAAHQAIRGAVFPFMDDSMRIHGALMELSNIGYVELGKSADGRSVGRVVNFEKHQVISRPRPSAIGPFEPENTHSMNNHGAIMESSVNTHGVLSAGKERKGSGMEVEKEGNRDMSGKPDAAAREVLEYLNEKAGRQFRDTSENLKLITARLKSVNGDTIGVMLMIDRQVKLWGQDPKMAEFLRPQTLFGKEKFGGYYDLRSVPLVNGSSQKPRGGPCSGDPCPVGKLNEFDFDNPGTIPGPPP